jgi:hypothetical protein
MSLRESPSALFPQEGEGDGLIIIGVENRRA